MTMKINLLVSLLSDQPVPNVQFIKEKGTDVDKYLFISTDQMDKKGVLDWIIKSAGIGKEKILPALIVNQFSFEDIKSKLDAIDFSDYENVTVNITGGTKVMSLAVYEYFKLITNEIYYLPGYDNTVIRLAPIGRPRVEKLNSSLNLTEYLEAYGFSMREGSSSGISAEYTRQFLNLFVYFNLEECSLINYLRDYRSGGVKTSKLPGLIQFIEKIRFPVENVEKLNKHQVKYLTGEWFEELVYERIKNELNLSEDKIKTGVTLVKSNSEGKQIMNEFDVIFVHDARLYTVECKTSVIIPGKDGSEPSNIIRETIFKSDSLQKGLGLLAQSSIFALDSRKVKIPEAHLDRAKLYRIKVRLREDIVGAENISSLII
jgi:hypothetical protein